jgi:predicted RNA-binding protein with PUA-like domain
MNYWLLKSDPDVYGWEQLVKDRQTTWDGIRNYQARINLRAMKPGDVAFIYHSQTDKAVVGVAKIVSDPHPDSKDAEWVAVDLVAEQALSSPVTLDVIKASGTLKTMPLVRHTRLSVMPITKAHADELLRLGK